MTTNIQKLTRIIGLEKCKETNSIYPESRFEIAGETHFGRTGAPTKSRKNKMEGKVKYI